MPTKPKNDAASIAKDARQVLDAALQDQDVPAFKKRVGKHELDTLRGNIEALEAGEAARTTSLHAQVAAGVHAGKARAALFGFLQDVRDDAQLTFREDESLQHAFGVGATPAAASTSSVRHVAEEVLSAAHAHTKEAAAIGLDTKGIHHLEDLVHALDGAELAHVHTATTRHESTTTTDSLAHIVAAEAAHLRLAARRVFRGDEAKLTRYARTLPRHEVVPRKHPTPPVAPA
jgi:hypothetical protein